MHADERSCLDSAGPYQGSKDSQASKLLTGRLIRAYSEAYDREGLSRDSGRGGDPECQDAGC